MSEITMQGQIALVTGATRGIGAAIALELAHKGVKVVGTATTEKLLALRAVPPAVVTLMGPVLAPAGTVAVIRVEELTTEPTAETPLKATPLTPTKFAPVIVTFAACVAGVLK